MPGIVTMRFNRFFCRKKMTWMGLALSICAVITKDSLRVKCDSHLHNCAGYGANNMIEYISCLVTREKKMVHLKQSISWFEDVWKIVWQNGKASSTTISDWSTFHAIFFLTSLAWMCLGFPFGEMTKKFRFFPPLLRRLLPIRTLAPFLP